MVRRRRGPSCDAERSRLRDRALGMGRSLGEGGGGALGTLFLIGEALLFLMTRPNSSSSSAGGGGLRLPPGEREFDLHTENPLLISNAFRDTSWSVQRGARFKC